MDSLGIWVEKKEALVPQKKSDLNLKCHTSLEALKKTLHFVLVQLLGWEGRGRWKGWEFSEQYFASTSVGNFVSCCLTGRMFVRQRKAVWCDVEGKLWRFGWEARCLFGRHTGACSPTCILQWQVHCLLAKQKSGSRTLLQITKANTLSLY